MTCQFILSVTSLCYLLLYSWQTEEDPFSA